MIVCRKREILYCDPPKTGSTSLAKALVTQCGGEVVPDILFRRHETIWSEEFLNWRIMLSVRNPYQRAISLWKMAIRYVSVIDDVHSKWWKDHGVTPQTSLAQFIRNPQTIDHMTTDWRCSWHIEQVPRSILHVIHMETFAEDIARIPFMKGVHVTHENRSPDLRNVDRYVTASARSAIEEIWEQDFVRLGYGHDQFHVNSQFTGVDK